MKIGPKYKIARRLGAPIFEKTQTQKFALSLSRKGKRGSDDRRPRAKTEFGLQMLEKQKARYTYGILERQFSRYAKESLEKKGASPAQELYARLERRLDNVVYRLGLASTRRFARQLVAHGHITVNGVRVTIPSYAVELDDAIRIREGSKGKPVFSKLDETLKTVTVPQWIAFNPDSKEAIIKAMPKLGGEPMQFNIESILDFYRR